MKNKSPVKYQVTEEQENEVLELVAQAESLLNLYMAAKRELNTVHGFVLDVSRFPVVQSMRQQIGEVRAIFNNPKS